MSSVLVISSTCGSGKTRDAVARICEDTERPAFVWVPRHNLAREVEARLSDGGRDPVRRFGVARAKGDDEVTPLCEMPSVAVPLSNAGASVPRALCASCDHAPTNGGSCRAFGGGWRAQTGTPLLVAPRGFGRLIHEQVDEVESAVAPFLVVDEPPPAIDSRMLAASDVRDALGALRGDEESPLPVLEDAYRTGARCVLEGARAALEALKNDRANDADAALALAAETLAADAAWRGRLDFVATLLSLPATTARETLRAVAERCAEPEITDAGRRFLATDRNAPAAATRLETFARAHLPARRWLAGEPARWDASFARLAVSWWGDELGQLLSAEAAPAILDATPDLPALAGAAARAGRELRHVHVHVADAAPVRRALLYSSNANRRAFLADGEPRWSRIGPMLVRALERLRAVEAERGSRVSWLLLVTIKPVRAALDALALRVPHPQAADALARWVSEGRRLDVEHYEALSGLDTWREADACLTLGDPWPPLDALAVEGDLLGLDAAGREARLRDRTGAALAQAHGRLRAPSRATPAVMMHVGAVLPLEWDRPNATTTETVERGRLRRGAGTMTADEVAAAVVAAGGVRALARVLGTTPMSVSRYAAGARAVPEPVSALIRSHVSGLRGVTGTANK